VFRVADEPSRIRDTESQTADAAAENRQISERRAEPAETCHVHAKVRRSLDCDVHVNTCIRTCRFHTVLILDFGLMWSEGANGQRVRNHGHTAFGEINPPCHQCASTGVWVGGFDLQDLGWCEYRLAWLRQ